MKFGTDGELKTGFSSGMLRTGEPMPTSHNRTKLSGVALFCLLVSAVVLVVEQACDAFYNPWAHSLSSSRRLTGSWMAHIPSNPERFVFLTLQRPRSPEGNYQVCDSCPDMEGWLRYCDATGTSNAYRISGDVRSWRGSTLTLRFDSVSPPFSVFGTQGRWDQADALTFVLHSDRLRRGSPPAKDSFISFRHAGELTFTGACVQLRQH